MVPKSLWFVLTIATHLIINGCSRAQVTGLLGHDVTLRFTFNTNITNSSHFAVYLVGQKKAEYCPWKGCAKKHGFDIYSENSFVFFQIINLTEEHNGTYSATLFPQSGPPEESNKVHLIVQEKSNKTVPHEQEHRKPTEYQPSIFSTTTITVLVVLPVISLAATLAWFFRCYVRARVNKADENSSPSTQVATVSTNNMLQAEFAYSVLDFPKKEFTVLTDEPNNTDYVKVYLPPYTK
ncbi:uncharacterized protein LOC133167337 [Syngnathus typhle]|uniref:uncharacterized protein LOC133167337 n=1 Tax=Syngnathus typhle TaxID=161592 RepID=UPI002A6AE253|nr:uncharacterized protein LOC133167337 [Syngnathus typhle]